jgi:hypothetical protein
MRKEQFGFRLRPITTLLLSILVERIDRHFDEKRLTSAVFLDVAKYSQLPNLPRKNTPSYLQTRRYKLLPFNSIGSLWYASWSGQGWTKVPVFSSLHVNMNKASPCLHDELAVLAEQTAVIATSYQPTLLVICLKT